MEKYICNICGYEYDNEKEEVNFKELSFDWECPLCGVNKDSFEKKNEDQQ